MKTLFVLIMLFAVLMFTGCANVATPEAEYVGHTYGFWGGLWHGIVSSIAFIGSLFSDDIAVFALNNNGGWYTFGFLWGCGAFAAAAASSTRE